MRRRWPRGIGKRSRRADGRQSILFGRTTVGDTVCTATKGFKGSAFHASDFPASRSCGLWAVQTVCSLAYTINLWQSVANSVRLPPPFKGEHVYLRRAGRGRVCCTAHRTGSGHKNYAKSDRLLSVECSLLHDLPERTERDGSILCGRLSRWKFLPLFLLFFLRYSIYKRQIITLCQFGTVLRTRAMCRRSITIRVCAEREKYAWSSTPPSLLRPRPMLAPESGRNMAVVAKAMNGFIRGFGWFWFRLGTEITGPSDSDAVTQLHYAIHYVTTLCQGYLHAKPPNTTCHYGCDSRPNRYGCWGGEAKNNIRKVGHVIIFKAK